MTSTKIIGDELERIVENYCKIIFNEEKYSATVKRNVKILGRSGSKRQIDVLTLIYLDLFELQIIFEAKNYKRRLGIKFVDEFIGKLEDVGGGIGVLISSNGFTPQAKDRAKQRGNIHIIHAFDVALKNVDTFIPIRMIRYEPDSYRFLNVISSLGYNLSNTPSSWLFIIDKNKYSADEFILRCLWNDECIPREKGTYSFDFKSIQIYSDNQSLDGFLYDFTVEVNVKEIFYLKLLSSSFFRIIGKEVDYHLSYDVPIATRHEVMIKNGWFAFSCIEDMEKVFNSVKKLPGVKDLPIMKHKFKYSFESK